MKAALDKAADRYTTDIRSLLREKKVQYAGVAREGTNVVDPLPRRRRAHEGARRDREGVPRPRCCAKPTARRRAPPGRRRSSRRRRSASRTARSSRTSRSCATASTSSASPSRSSSSRAPTASSCSCPGVQDTARAKDILGRTATLEIRMVNDDPGALEAALAGQRAVRQRSLHRAQRRPGAGAAAGRADRRSHQRRAAGLRPAHQRARRAREPRRHRRAHLQGSHARERRQADGDRAGREGQGRGHHRAGDPRGDRRRPRPDQRPDEHARGERHRAPDARRRAGGADGDRRGAHRRPVARQGEHRQGLQLGDLRLHRARDLHVRLLPADGRHLDDRAVGQPAAAGRAAVDAAGDADAARHRGHRADARHGDRRQRADQRAHPRGAALGRDAARGADRRATSARGARFSTPT